MISFYENFLLFANAAPPTAETVNTLTPSGWASMLCSVGAVTFAFVWCLTRVSKRNSTAETNRPAPAEQHGEHSETVAVSAVDCDGQDWEKVRTLNDLRHWNSPKTSLAVVGMPIAHSLSPRMHNAALNAINAPELAGWRYFKFEIPPDALGEALTLFHQHGFRGINLTLPHKVCALASLTRVDVFAAASGAANTLVREENGYAGYNTDGAGFVRALRETQGVTLENAVVVLLGAGGAARAIAASALDTGCRELWIGNRSAGRRAELLAQLREKKPDARATLHEFAMDAPPPAFPAGAVVVNATSLGLRDGDPSPLPAALWQRGMIAFDIVCGTGETAFLREARARGIPSVDGLPMLCWQGALAFELWTGRSAPVQVMLDALTRPPTR
ncbi:MAG: shikimate dehydrogenase [Puniceicoccales bacterium]|jgi:shikimate dehydrogenase|nr:shikimate dehydrogenase [Puniceicoccales bacterium]